MTNSGSQPQRQMSDAIVNGKHYHLIAFYFPDDRAGTAWDRYYNYECFGNFWVCPAKITLTIAGITGTFHTTEAAFQATKWWKHDSLRQQFEAAPDGPAAVHVKKIATQTAKPDQNRDHGYAGLGQREAMRAVLRLKFNDPGLQQILVGTGDAYLLEHNPDPDRDDTWSDNHDGSGTNYLGITLMEVRAKLPGGSGPPLKEGSFDMADFTRQVKPAP